MTILNFILENAPARLIQESVKEFNVKGIVYKMRNDIINEFPQYRGHAMQFGVDMSEALEEFKTDQILLTDINNQIISIQKKLSLFGKWHPQYLNLCTEHDALVTISNKLNEPIAKFLKLYKKAQKAKGLRLSVVKKSEIHFSQPA